VEKRIKIILFTRIKALAGCVLEQLSEKKLAADAIFIEKRNAAGVGKRARNILKKQGFIALLKEIFSYSLNRLKLKKNSKLTSINYYKEFCSSIYFFERFNSKECIEKLKETGADIVIVAGAGILSKELLEQAGIFFINAHPGLLPYYRGVDVLQAAILNGDEPYVTVHRIDAGVDTGKILCTEKIPLAKNDTFDSLREKSIQIAGRMLAETVLKVNNGEPLEEKENRTELGKQYYMMNPKELKKAEEKLKLITARIGS
jgi:methionyl-tRNA formyltransferase